MDEKGNRGMVGKRREGRRGEEWTGLQEMVGELRGGGGRREGDTRKCTHVDTPACTHRHTYTYAQKCITFNGKKTKEERRILLFLRSSSNPARGT